MSIPKFSRVFQVGIRKYDGTKDNDEFIMVLAEDVEDERERDVPAKHLDEIRLRRPEERCSAHIEDGQREARIDIDRPVKGNRVADSVRAAQGHR